MAARPMARGSNVALTRELPGLTGVVIGVSLVSGEPVLADNVVVATLLCDGSSRVLSAEHVVFFNQLVEPDGSVTPAPAAAGEDVEQVEVDLAQVPPEVARIVVVAFVNEAMAQRRTLGQLRRAAIRLLDRTDDQELVRSVDLAPELSTETALVLGELYRHGGDWKFKVIGQGYTDGILGVARDHGIPL